MLKLYNSLTRKKENFTPLDPKNIRMYVCGPTVYNTPHIGNARAVVVYDILFRLLQKHYGKENVTYVRNITDVDDKIIAAAKDRNIPISILTEGVTAGFHHDMAALNCLPPSVEPRATEYISKMITMIQTLIDRHHAYVSEGHVLFSVESDENYGKLSGRTLEKQQAGARVEVGSYKHHPGDFVLWKPSAEGDDASASFDSPWGVGRPGWHIECSAMSTDQLGETFDIHGGGADLKFPHHENEIAQSRCANPESKFAQYWVHNGFLTVNGEKMSKSLGNFVTVRELLDKGVKGEVIRFALMRAKYNEPLDWNEELIKESTQTLNQWYRNSEPNEGEVPKDFLEALKNDLNLPLCLSIMNNASPEDRYTIGKFLGFGTLTQEEWFKGSENDDNAEIEALVAKRSEAKRTKNWEEADRLRALLKEKGIIIEDRPDGTSDWRRA